MTAEDRWDEEDAPPLIVVVRTRAQVERELIETQHRRVAIRAEWDGHAWAIDACRLQHRLAVEAITGLQSELAALAAPPVPARPGRRRAGLRSAS